MSLAAPREGEEKISSTMGLRLRPLRETRPAMVMIDLPLEVVPSPVVSCFFGAMAHWRGFLRRGLVGEKFEYRDSDINKSTSLWWRFSLIYWTVDPHHRRE